jgi:hypothetical protein
LARIVNAITSRARAAVLAVGIFLLPAFCTAMLAGMANLSVICPATSQPSALTKSQSDALHTYNNAVHHFRSILSERRAQNDSNQQQPHFLRVIFVHIYPS